ncbi:olfactory receptor 2K2-like [Discoglossus pictus]
MAYDRYVAICFPLSYSFIMNKRVCALLATTSWLMGTLNSMMFALIVSNLSFCGLHKINHIFCDLQSLLKNSCSVIKYIRCLIFADGVLLGWFPFMIIMISYIYIISTILKIRDSGGRSKAFSSCSSHLTVVIMLYVTCLSLNMKPTSEHFQELDKILSLLYIAVVPILNPLVYSLRNKDVINGLKKCLK